ncbi:GNAT family N-acetyltransferase [Pseudomonas huanghezhanensis]|uniref:GNAT family N-acetyltransferase n=1 Tax=Pseudomonas huanghezhanensis TaxID=3002903 RepID=UPI002285C10A|nr:GNAT family N-acetyltransferase [Pseudomonas sp. BSw22131]
MPHDSVIYLPKTYDYAELARLWEESVRATHDFLPDDYIALLKRLLLTQYLDAVNLFCLRDTHLNIKGFAGTTPGKLEMLFIAPQCRGQGLGKRLLNYAIEQFDITELDVNEQNLQALGFYISQGFEVAGRAELDGLGRPYPMLQMKLRMRTPH